MIPAELITLELARLTEVSTAWERRFKRYDQLIDAGLSCEEAACIVTQAEADRAELNEHELEAAA